MMISISLALESMTNHFIGLRFFLLIDWLSVSCSVIHGLLMTLLTFTYSGVNWIKLANSSDNNKSNQIFPSKIFYKCSKLTLHVKWTSESFLTAFFWLQYQLKNGLGFVCTRENGLGLYGKKTGFRQKTFQVSTNWVSLINNLLILWTANSQCRISQTL